MTHHSPWLGSYDEGIDPRVPLPDSTLVDTFDKIRTQVPDKPALRFLGVTLTYARLMALADAFAGVLRQHGAGPGHVVGINLPNTPQYLIAQIGALKAGCASSGLSPLLTAAEMVHQLNDCRAKVLITLDPIFEHRLAGVADELPHLELVIVTRILEFLPAYKRLLAKVLKKVPTGRISELSGKTVIAFRDIMAKPPGKSNDVTVRPDDTALIQYTGGTTGVPKGTVLTHRNMVAELTIVLHWLKMEFANEIILSGFPFFHIAGLALGLGTIFKGLTQILIPDPRNTKHIVREMAKYHPTILVNVPSLYMMLSDTPGFRSLDFSSLKYCLSAASPFPAESIRELESIIGDGKLIEVYGMTEAGSLLTMNPRFGPKKIGSVGLPLPHTDIRLVDLDTGEREVGPDEEGEITAHGPQIMQGYLNKPEETAITLREHAGRMWLHTGDVARMDEDGYFYLVDRAKDMLNVGGFKVFSREVEDTLYALPAIEFCAVIGIPNPERPGSELVKLVCQPAEDYRELSTEELQKAILDFARERLAPYKVPKIIERIDKMPLTSVGKVDKKALRHSVE